MQVRGHNSSSAQNENFLGEDGIIRNIYRLDQNASTLQQVEKELLELTTKLRKRGKRVLIFTDVSQVGKIPLSARVAGVEVMKRLDFDKVAIFGPSRLEKTIVNVVCQASGKSFKTKYFTDEIKAFTWLRGEYV